MSMLKCHNGACSIRTQSELPKTLDTMTQLSELLSSLLEQVCAASSNVCFGMYCTLIVMTDVTEIDINSCQRRGRGKGR